MGSVLTRRIFKKLCAIELLLHASLLGELGQLSNNQERFSCLSVTVSLKITVRGRLHATLLTPDRGFGVALKRDFAFKDIMHIKKMNGGTISVILIH